MPQKYLRKKRPWKKSHRKTKTIFKITSVWNMNRKRKHSSGTFHSTSKRPRRGCSWNLPDEVLVEIFSYLALGELYSTVPLVCKRWNRLAKDATLWSKIEAGASLPTQVLVDWILTASQLKHLIVTDRNDLNFILEVVSQNCKILQTIEVVNCWGSSDKRLVKSTPLCHLIERCCRLRNISFDRIRFKSCKFFDLLRQDKTKVARSCSYIGPVSIKQLSTIIRSLSLGVSAVEIPKLLKSLNKLGNHYNALYRYLIDIIGGEEVDAEVLFTIQYIP